MNDFEKLINASDLIEWIMEIDPDWCVGTTRSIVDYVEDLPPAEVEPVKRGKWINDKGLYRCSECNELWTAWWANVVPIERMNKTMRYCPHCGAKMEGVEDE